MQLTLPGAISLYYGQEYNLKDVERSGQRGIMQWHPRVLTPGDNHHGFTGRTDSIFFGESENSDNNDNFQVLNITSLSSHFRINSTESLLP